MARRGRKPTGANLVEHLEGSEHAKARLKVILETLAAQRTIPEACAELGIHESMFHRVRLEVLQTALNRLEPRPLGRPPRQPLPGDMRVAELGEEKLRLEFELKAAEVRRELAENLPRLARRRPDPPQPPIHTPAAGPGKKTNHRTAKRHRRPK
jgi:hypothetical protein